MMLRTPLSTLFPYTTLFRSRIEAAHRHDSAAGVFQLAGHHRPEERLVAARQKSRESGLEDHRLIDPNLALARSEARLRSEEHTSELQSHSDLVCRLLLEKKK